MPLFYDGFALITKALHIRRVLGCLDHGPGPFDAPPPEASGDLLARRPPVFPPLWRT